MKRGVHPIGVFDSGFGGITILREIVKALPQYDYLYLGDTARTPYGTRSQEVVYEFTAAAVDFLFGQGCELIILACNTASAEALRRIQQEYLPTHHPDKRVLGVLIPASEEAASKTKSGRIGVLGTEGTVASRAFEREITKLNPALRVYQQAAPLLVPLVEAGQHRSKAAELILHEYLAPLQKKKIDTLVLGCTHYGVLEPHIKKIIGTEIRIISEGRIVARKFAEYLTRHAQIEKRISRRHHVRFVTTDLTPKFETLGSRFFGSPIKAEKITLQ